MHKNWNFSHVCILVRDMEKAIRHFEALGVGPFPPLIGGTEGMPLTEQTVRGEPSNYDMDLRMCREGMGGLGLELIQPLKGNSIYDEFLEEKGEGVHHVCYNVEDLDKEITEMEQLGFKVIQTGAMARAKWAYFNTDMVGGIIIELGQRL